MTDAPRDCRSPGPACRTIPLMRAREALLTQCSAQLTVREVSGVHHTQRGSVGAAYCFMCGVLPVLCCAVLCVLQCCVILRTCRLFAASFRSAVCSLPLFPSESHRIFHSSLPTLMCVSNPHTTCCLLSMLSSPDPVPVQRARWVKVGNGMTVHSSMVVLCDKLTTQAASPSGCTCTNIDQSQHERMQR